MSMPYYEEIIKDAIRAIAADMIQLTNIPDPKDNTQNKEIYFGLGIALGRIYEAVTHNDMRAVGPFKILEWARGFCNDKGVDWQNLPKQ